MWISIVKAEWLGSHDVVVLIQSDVSERRDFNIQRRWGGLVGVQPAAHSVVGTDDHERQSCHAQSQ